MEFIRSHDFLCRRVSASRKEKSQRGSSTVELWSRVLGFSRSTLAHSRAYREGVDRSVDETKGVVCFNRSCNRRVDSWPVGPFCPGLDGLSHLHFVSATCARARASTSRPRYHIYHTPSLTVPSSTSGVCLYSSRCFRDARRIPILVSPVKPCHEKHSQTQRNKVFTFCLAYVYVIIGTKA